MTDWSKRAASVALFVAAALLGSERALSSVTGVLSDVGELAKVGEFLRREEDGLRREVLARLCLDDLGPSEALVDQAAVVDR